VGHVRIGFLPHTRQWNAIIAKLSSFDNERNTIAEIADSTLNAIQKDYDGLQYDESVISAIKCLANIIVSSRQKNQVVFLQQNGFQVDDSISLFSLTASIQHLIQTSNGSLETNKLARDAAIQAIMLFCEQHIEQQLNLFHTNNNPFIKKNSGKEFCELARYFFASFTEKKIRYYIDREASNQIDDYGKYISFSDNLSKYSLDISEHAFEISKIMQSFAAGWFNNHALDIVPTNDSVTQFLKTAFGKVREELRLEVMKNE